MPTRINRTRFGILLAACALALPAGAQVYKWVDEKGVTHYGERPPQDKKAQALPRNQGAPDPAPEQAAQPNWQEKELEFRRRRIETEQAEAQAKQQKAYQEAVCNQARDHIAQMKAARNVYRLDEKGQRVIESDEERAASIARQEQQVAQRCR